MTDSIHVHFVVHETFEGPGAFAIWVHDRGHTATYSRVYDYEPLPQDPSGIDLLVVLGGPQSAATTTAECPHFDRSAECDLIKSCIAAGKAVVGVCLGAQLIGEALGATFAPSPESEIGNFPITLTTAGRAHDKISHFGDSLEVGHWHNDMPGLTPDATVLATSAGCPRQIIEYSDRVYGLQCHLEFTPQLIELLLAQAGTELDASSNRFVQRADALRSHDYTTMNRMLYGFLDKLVPAPTACAAASGSAIPTRAGADIGA